MSSSTPDQPAYTSSGSAALMKQLHRSAAYYLVSALYNALIAKGETKEKTYESMAEFIGLLRGDDIFVGGATVEEAILSSQSYIESMKRSVAYQAKCPQRRGNCYAWDAIDSVRWSFEYLLAPKETPTDDPQTERTPEGLTPVEVALAKKLDAARRAFYAAEREYNKYFSLKAIKAIQDFVSYYSDAIGKIDAGWCAEFSKALENERKYYAESAGSAVVAEG